MKCNKGGLDILANNCRCSTCKESRKAWRELCKNLTNNPSPIPLTDQPERSKREEPSYDGMRCSEHCGNTVRDK